MVTRRNLAVVPALKVNNPSNPSRWFGPSGWARITGAHASLPRSTAFAGTTAGDLAASRVDVVAGRYYVFSVSARFVAPSTGAVNIDWYSGLGYLVTTSGPSYSQASSTTNRFAVMAQAPADAVRAVLVPAGIDGESQWTALMVEEFTDLADAEDALAYSVIAANYFDGDTPGASWDADDGESTSTYITDAPASGLVVMPVPVGTGLGVRTSTGTGLAELLPPIGATGLFATATYDDRRGRIRVQVQGLASSVIRAIVYSRATGTSRWRVIRGGRVAVANGRFVRAVDDYEWPAGPGVEYRIDALSSPENVTPESVVQTAFADIGDVLDAAWLKFIPAPHTNIKVRLIADPWELEQQGRNSVHEIDGRPDPIVVTDVHGSISTSVRFITHTDAERIALGKALSQGAPGFLHVPASVPLPSMYVAIGTHRAVRTGNRRTSRKYVWTVQITQVSPPPPSVVGSGMTWGTLLEQYETWGDVLEAFPTWRDVIG
jgi:hypothetical protein